MRPTAIGYGGGTGKLSSVSFALGERDGVAITITAPAAAAPSELRSVSPESL